MSYGLRWDRAAEAAEDSNGEKSHPSYSETAPLAVKYVESDYAVD